MVNSISAERRPKNMTFRLFLSVLLACLLNRSLLAQSISNYARECSMRTSWFKNNFSELDSVGLLDDQAWTLKYARSDGRFRQQNGLLDVQVADSAVLDFEGQFYFGSFAIVDDGMEFHDLYRIALRSTEYSEHIESFIQFQVRKISSEHLVIDVFQKKRGKLRCGTRLVFARSQTQAK